MKRFALLVAITALLLALVACSSPAAGNPDRRIPVGEDGVVGGPVAPEGPKQGNGGSAPAAPDLPDLDSDGDGGLEITEMRIMSDTNATKIGGTVNLTLELPARLEGATIRWSSDRPGVGHINEFTPSRDSKNPTWNAGNQPGTFKITAKATLGAVEEYVSIDILVTKTIAPALRGPNHVGFWNPATFQVIHAPGATVVWDVSNADELPLTTAQDGLSTIWEPQVWRNQFYTISATVSNYNVDEPDEVVVLTREFSTSFCSTGRTNDPDNPCGIENINQLAGIHNWLDGHFKVLSDIDAAETKLWTLDGDDDRYGFWPLGADVTQDPVPFGSPQRNITTYFSGSFDGGGHTISDLHIVWPGTVGVGLFGFVKEGTVIQNVHLERATVVGYEFVGGIAGRSDGIITQSSVTDSTIQFAGHGRDCSSLPNLHQGDRVGGVVGLVSSSGGAVTESYALRTNVTGCTWVGGLAGIIAGEVTDSYSMEGTVNAPATLANGEHNYWRGGFTGHLTGNQGVARTFALMAGNVGYVGAVSGNAALAQSYWSNAYPGAAIASPAAENISAAEFASIANNWAGWRVSNDGPGDFVQVPDLNKNPR